MKTFLKVIGVIIYYSFYFLLLYHVKDVLEFMYSLFKSITSSSEDLLVLLILPTLAVVCLFVLFIIFLGLLPIAINDKFE